ncbi:MAG: hypothetical protein ABI912_12740 [Actinomycetota bacterium]
MRVYLPSTFAGLHELRTNNVIGPAPLHGHAVTPALRESYAVGDTEELEHVAQLAASSDSISLLHEDQSVPRRRVVLAVEVPEESVVRAEDGDESSVTVGAAVPISDVQAILVDDPDAADVVERAAEAWSAAQTGDDDALFQLDEATAHDLMWFARQELDQLLS